MPSKNEKIQKEVTAHIIAKLEAGVRPWSQPWQGGLGVPYPTRHEGSKYQGINVLLLWISAMENGYNGQYWMTYRQAQQYGGQVRKGEKGSMIVFAKPIKVKDLNSDDPTAKKDIFFYKPSKVFNVSQIDGLPERFYPKPVVEIVNPDQRVASVDAYVANTGANISEDGDKAFYAPGPDKIVMPAFDKFKSALDFYSTELHELVHWTGHKSRVNRDFKVGEGRKDYAKEELVAEMGAAFLCAALGLESTVRDDHAEYLASWLKALKDDHKYIFQASSAASKAVAFLDNLQPVEDEVSKVA